MSDIKKVVIGVINDFIQKQSEDKSGENNIVFLTACGIVEAKMPLNELVDAQNEEKNIIYLTNATVWLPGNPPIPTKMPFLTLFYDQIIGVTLGVSSLDQQ